MSAALVVMKESIVKNSVSLQQLLSSSAPNRSMQQQMTEKGVNAPTDQSFTPTSNLLSDFMRQGENTIKPTLKELNITPISPYPQTSASDPDKWFGDGPHPTSTSTGDSVDGLKDSVTSSYPVPTEGSPNTKRPHVLNKSSTNDPLSHRIIEKRRRDRMNNCLADLSRLIPSYYLKKGRGRIEKTEIIEMAIKYLQHLQTHACNNIETCDVTARQKNASTTLEYFQMGYQEAMSETLAFLRDSEGFFSGDSLCVRIMNHLTKHCENLLKNESCLNKSVSREHSSSSSSSSGYHANGSSSDGNSVGSSQSMDSKEAIMTGEESAYRSDDRMDSTNLESVSFEITNNFKSEMTSNGQTSEVIQHPSLENSHMGSYLSSSGSASSNSSSDDNNGNRLYKFKSNMKHRFSVDSEHNQVKKKRRDSGSSCGYTDGEKDSSMKRSGNHSHPIYSRPSSRPSHLNHAGHEDRLACSQGVMTLGLPAIVNKKYPGEESVPIFALNSAGSFYVPLMVDYSIVASAMEEQRDITPVLHPISIYVNFCSSIKRKIPHNPNSLLSPLRNFNSCIISNESSYANPSVKESLGVEYYNSQTKSYNRTTQSAVDQEQSFPTSSIPSCGKRNITTYSDHIEAQKLRPQKLHESTHFSNYSYNNHASLPESLQRGGNRDHCREHVIRHREENQPTKEFFNKHSAHFIQRGAKHLPARESKPWNYYGTSLPY